VDLPAGDPLAAPARFADSVAAAVRGEQVAVVLPITDAALLALLPRRDELRPAIIPFPDLAQVRTVGNKRLVVDAAARAGIAVPAQAVLESPSGASGLQTMPPAFPLVVKPSRSVADRADAGREKLSVRHARDAAELEQVLRALPPNAYPVLLQQRVVGPGIGIFLLLWDGRLVATFAHRRIREKPPAGGVSVYRESIAADPDLVSRSRALLDHFGWSGVAMIEYKLDRATAIPYLMEINGRFWGSLQLAIDAGVDFPALLVALALGEEPASVSSYRVGVRSRWWLGDLDQLLARLRRTPAELALPPGTPGRLAALGEFLALWRPGDRGEILRFADPAPACRELANWLRRR
jgi:predicted ATP-grasp superfamily ATP-dependent carboligase